jgi:hypothetical protein
MLYREIMAICSEIHTKHINTVCVHKGGILEVDGKIILRTEGQCGAGRAKIAVYLEELECAVGKQSEVNVRHMGLDRT